jgi:hypothetical protein
MRLNDWIPVELWRESSTGEKFIMAAVGAVLLGLVALGVAACITPECPEGQACVARAPTYTVLVPYYFDGKTPTLLPQTHGGECTECAPVETP